MADPHQVMTIIATAIHNGSKQVDPEQAKQIAKSICEALADAGLEIVPIQKG